MARLSRLDARLAYARLTLVAAIALSVFLIVGSGLPVWIAAALLIGFAALVVVHDRVLQQSDRAARAVAFYDRGLARIEDRWQADGDRGDRFASDDHLYARDLDVFGAGSLFQLLSQTRTHLGEERLAGWLSAPASVDEIRSRQGAVAELAAALDFREALATSGGSAADVDTVSLAAWATAPAHGEARWLRIVAALLSAGIVGGAIWWARGGPLAPLATAILLKMLLTRRSRGRVAAVVRGVERPLRDLDILAAMLVQLEAASFASSRLAALRDRMLADGAVPSLAIRRLKRLADMLDWRRNPFFAPFSAALSWPLHLAAAIEAWRQHHGRHVPAWLDAMAEFEALGSLAAYAYEHPHDPFPHLDDTGAARFEGSALGHPLLPAARMVRNDVALTEPVRLLVVSGSNMSGKSTLLRTVGINAVLAMAGAPVRARALTMTPLAIGATLQVNDSLQAGRSRFYTEISRIRRIADLLDGPVPLLFLLDELFQGTNSHDRRIGAGALLSSLVDRGAIGLTTTHDLALTAIADASDGRAVNVHFEDRLEGGDLVFDYRMKPGPVTHSNALALMRAVGLPAPPA